MVIALRILKSDSYWPIVMTPRPVFGMHSAPPSASGGAFPSANVPVLQTDSIHWSDVPVILPGVLSAVLCLLVLPESD